MQTLGQALTTTVPSADPIAPVAITYLTASLFPTPLCALVWEPDSPPDAAYAMVHMAVHPTTGVVNKSSGFKLVGLKTAPLGNGIALLLGVGVRYPGLGTGWKLFTQMYCVRADGVRSVASTTTAVIENGPP
jgi:hypothetical protein